jgi:hypothetical protein
MALEWVETIGHGLFKNHKNRKEKVVRVTKTLVVTEFGRYDKRTGADVDATNKTVGGFKLSEESKAAMKDGQ